MNKREYVAKLHTLECLPQPGTVLYPPTGQRKGSKLLRYEITEGDVLAVVESGIECLIEVYWSLKQVKQCTWNKFEGGE